ncbi:V-type ATPase 116kDa subunit family protein [Vulcanisaeta distributa]|uniref:A-type ATP synthase subunit I n=1 Tax=Vulcanisaeta distributa (strain DSM 14429 / JCM 11212 / NBRC 100878 / IC-017) TaxID=572478 RepID=E1QPA6_VULDI|nr:V-type ATPase 116kDa subunit family protein [Vulcanisaeta distributa]ADN50277.1 V-type ATPase 116 kDa subunit [Vulcanisaeta distributa DSM 14429]
MPIARLIEYKIALPSEHAFDLLMNIGNAGYFMPITRPGVIPAPRVPGKYSEKIRRVEDISRELSRILNQYSIPPPATPHEVKISLFNELLEYIIEDGEDLLTRVRQYLDSIEGVRNEYVRLRGIVDVMSSVGEIIMERLRHFLVDIVPISEEDFNEFRNTVVNYGAETLPVKVQDRFYALVIYPEWSKQSLLSAYRLFNTNPLEIPNNVDLDSMKSKLAELEGRLGKLEQEFRDFLTKVSDRAYAIIDLSDTITNIVRQYMDSAIPEGRDIGDRLTQLVNSVNDTRNRIRELEIVHEVLGYTKKAGISFEGLSRLRIRVFAVRGGVNEDYIKGLMYIKRDVEGTDLSILTLIEPPESLDVKSLGKEVYEISRDYLADIKSAFDLTGRELTDLRSRLKDLEKEYEEFVKEFNEVSTYGVDGINKVSGDVVTIAGYVKESLSSKFDDLLASLLSKLAIDAKVRKESKVVYVREIEPEKAPTLEEYPKLIDAFKKITYMYGVPKYTEISPIILTFILFPAFYGWMYPDLGHGVVLSLFGYTLYKSRYKGPNAFLRSIFGGKYSTWGLVFLMAGIWSIIFTFVESGTVFGIEVLPALFRLVHVGGTALEVLSNSIYAMLTVSIMVGIISLLLAFAFKAINAYRGGERDLALGFYVPLFFFFLFLVLALMGPGFVPVIRIGEETPLLQPLYPLFNTIEGLMWYWVYAVFATLAILMYSLFYFRAKYRGVPGFSAAQLAVEVSAEAAIPSLTNTISFMRLSIVAIMHAVFTAMTYAWAVSLGLFTPAGLAVLIIFNLIIILGEGFVAFVQSLRLHFYEMYTKFFSGAGVLFTPFTLGLRWVRLLIV